jgi:tetratricopeptide (TPR) repeat protein
MRSQLARAQMEREHFHDAHLELAAAADAAVAAGNRRLEASVLEFTGRVLLEEGRDLAAAEAAFAAAIAIAHNTDIGNRRGAAISLHHLGRTYRQLGRLDDSVQSLGQALAIFEELADEHNQGRVLISLGEAHGDRGAYDNAKEALDRSIEIMRRRGVLFQVGQALEALATLAHLTGDTATERRHQRNALDLYQKAGNPRATHLRAVLEIENEDQR